MSQPTRSANKLTVGLLIVVGVLIVPAQAEASPARLRSLPILENSGELLVINMFDNATPPRGRVPCARNVLATNEPFAGLPGLAPASSLFAFCKEPSSHTCRWDCQTCQLGMDFSYEPNLCGEIPCSEAGECQLTPLNRCCQRCEYNCHDLQGCYGCQAPLRCGYHW